MTIGKRSKLTLTTPLEGKLTIVQMYGRNIHTKYALIDILELEKSQFTFESSLILPTDNEIIYGFELIVANRTFHCEGCIDLVSKHKDIYLYKAAVQPNDYVEFELLYEINQLATLHNKEFARITKSYEPDRYYDDVVVNYIC